MTTTLTCLECGDYAEDEQPIVACPNCGCPAPSPKLKPCVECGLEVPAYAKSKLCQNCRPTRKYK